MKGLPPALNLFDDDVEVGDDGEVDEIGGGGGGGRGEGGEGRGEREGGVRGEDERDEGEARGGGEERGEGEGGRGGARDEEVFPAGPKDSLFLMRDKNSQTELLKVSHIRKRTASIMVVSMCPLFRGSTIHKEEDNLSIMDK